MKIFFNQAFSEVKRETEDLWVKGNNGNNLTAYFEGVNTLNTTARLIIRWSNNETTIELPMARGLDRKSYYITLPVLAYSGETSFTIKLYNGNVLSHSAIFTRNILDSIDAKDCVCLDPTDKDELYGAINDIDVKTITNRDDIETNKQSIASLQADVTNKLDKTKEPFQVYGTDYLGEQTTIPYSVEVQENKPTIPLRDSDGRLKVETPIEPQHAVNKDYADFLALVNKLPIYEVSEYNNHTGEITLKINTNVVENIDTSDLEHKGIIRMYANIFNWECPKNPKGDN